MVPCVLKVNLPLKSEDTFLKASLTFQFKLRPAKVCLQYCDNNAPINPKPKKQTD